MILSRKHPYICFALGMILCGIKFPFNWIARDNGERQEAMEATSFGILDPDPRMADAWDRIEGKITDDDIKDGRRGFSKLMHDLTNLPIEWDRRWLPYSTKFFCSIIVLLFAGLLVISWL